jgi:enoyl-CoA hydratase/carnithine racemase
MQRTLSIGVRALSSSSPSPVTLHLDSATRVATVTLNRPSSRNAFTSLMLRELRTAFEGLARDPGVRSIILAAEGRDFSAGLDLKEHGPLLMGGDERDPPRKAAPLLRRMQDYTATVSSLENCGKPVIAVVHGNVLGLGLELIAAADIRVASSDAIFQVTEVAVGLIADLGTLQRLPYAIRSDSLLREMVLTGRRLTAAEAMDAGLLSAVDGSKEAAMERGKRLALCVSSFSPVAVQSAKAVLNFSRGRPISDGLAFNHAVASLTLQGEDLPLAMRAAKGGASPPDLFRDL